MSTDRVIVLAAGKGFQLDGMNKILIRHPKTKKTILDHIVDAFSDKEITVVVGYRAIEIMEQYSELNYIINHDWALTNNAMSLAVALDDRATYVVSGDLFINKEMVLELDQSAENLALVQNRENRNLTSIHCQLNTVGHIEDTYQGPIKHINHPESLGLFKITDTSILQEWKRQCFLHSNLFAGLLLPCTSGKVVPHHLNNDFFHEINTANDYLNLIQKVRLHND